MKEFERIPDIAIRHLEMVLEAVPEDGTLVEYGCGWSTVWFAEHLHPNQNLISVEHDPKWWGEILPHVVNNEQVELLLKPALADPGPYGSHFRENPTGLSDYIWGVDHESSDVIFIDGVARGACFAVSYVQSEPGTKIFVHDSQRVAWYGWAYKFANQGSIVIHPPAEGHPSELLECRL